MGTVEGRRSGRGRRLKLVFLFLLMFLSIIAMGAAVIIVKKIELEAISRPTNDFDNFGKKI